MKVNPFNASRYRQRKRTHFPWLQWSWVRPNYLQRMPLVPRNGWLNVYLHRYVKGETLDFGLHDHPWHSVSFLLRGWLYELILTAAADRPFPAWEYVRCKWWGGMLYAPKYKKFEWRFVPRVCFRRARDAHAIVDVAPGTLTLFITGPRIRWWGFWDGRPCGVNGAGKPYYDNHPSTGWTNADIIHKELAEGKLKFREEQ